MSTHTNGQKANSAKVWKRDLVRPSFAARTRTSAFASSARISPSLHPHRKRSKLSKKTMNVFKQINEIKRWIEMQGVFIKDGDIRTEEANAEVRVRAANEGRTR